MVDEDGTSPAEFCENLWNNWTPRGGKNQCEQCPAHWSIRTDYPGDAESRESSYGHRPWYGDGHLSDVDVVILGHEPGPGSIGEEEVADTNWIEHRFGDAHTADAATVPDDAGSLERTKPLFTTLADAVSVYWTQAKKCNVVTEGASGVNNEAERQCVGLGEHEGYLAEELSVVDPAYIIGLGTDVHRLFTSLYDVESLGNPFSREIASGDTKSGLRVLSVEREQFYYIPTAHPSRGVHQMTSDQLDLEGVDGNTKSERYYQLFADDFIEQVASGGC